MNATVEDFQKLEMRTGVITAVEDVPRARKPVLVGMQVVGVANFPSKKLARFKPDALPLGVPGEAGNLSIFKPNNRAKLGERLC